MNRVEFINDVGPGIYDIGLIDPYPVSQVSRGATDDIIIAMPQKRQKTNKSSSLREITFFTKRTNLDDERSRPTQ